MMNSKIELIKPLINIIDLLENIQIEHLIVGGGEPFLREDIFEILKKCVKRFKTTVLTNGTLINKKVAENLKRIGIDGISISLDSSRPEIHDSLRDRSFSLALESIKTCTKYGMDVDIGVCIHKKNFKDSINLIKMAENLGLSSITFEGINPVGRGKYCKYLQLTAEETDCFLNRIHEYLKDMKPTIDVRVFYPQWVRWKSDAAGCEVGKNFFGILPNGEFLPCTNVPISLGNILKEDFWELWNSEMMDKLRNNRKGGCGICKYREKCGGCRSKAYGTGDLFGSDPSCTLSGK